MRDIDNVPDLIASLHSDPLRDGSVLLLLLGEEALDLERLVGRLGGDKRWGRTLDHGSSPWGGQVDTDQATHSGHVDTPAMASQVQEHCQHSNYN